MEGVRAGGAGQQRGREDLVWKQRHHRHGHPGRHPALHPPALRGDRAGRDRRRGGMVRSFLHLLQAREQLPRPSHRHLRGRSDCRIVPREHGSASPGAVLLRSSVAHGGHARDTVLGRRLVARRRHDAGRHPPRATYCGRPAAVRRQGSERRLGQLVLRRPVGGRHAPVRRRQRSRARSSSTASASTASPPARRRRSPATRSPAAATAPTTVTSTWTRPASCASVRR